MHVHGLQSIAKRDASRKSKGRRTPPEGGGRSWSGGPALAVLVALGLSTAAYGATVMIDCSDTSDFCTGNPCITTANLVITVSSCTLDFMAADLQIEKKVVVPNGGSLSLNAANIEVNGKIDGKHTKVTEGDAADVTLTSPGNITIKKKVDVSGRATPGSILLDAAGNVVLEQKLRARAKGHNPTAPGGTITVEADGTVSSIKRAKIEVRGKKNVTSAGTIQISGDAGVDLKGRIEARGLFGGTVAVTSATGNVNIEEEIRAYGESSSGGTVDLSAPSGSVTVVGKKGRIRLAGGLPDGGGTGTVTAATAIDVKKVNASGFVGAPGGSVTMVGQSVVLDKVILRGGDAGTLDVTSTGGDVEIGRIDADARVDQGGTVNVDAANDATIDGPVDVSGKVTGGEARFQAGNNLTLGKNNKVKIEAEAPTGGVIEAQATNDITAQGRFSAETGGCIGLVAGGTLTITTGSTFSPTQQTSPCP